MSIHYFRDICFYMNPKWNMETVLVQCNMGTVLIFHFVLFMKYKNRPHIAPMFHLCSTYFPSSYYFFCAPDPVYRSGNDPARISRAFAAGIKPFQSDRLQIFPS